MAKNDLKNLLEQLHLSKEQTSRVQNLLETFDLPETLTEELDPEQIMEPDSDDTFFLGEWGESQQREIPLGARKPTAEAPLLGRDN